MIKKSSKTQSISWPSSSNKREIRLMVFIGKGDEKKKEACLLLLMDQKGI